MPLCGALLTLTKFSTSFIVNLGFSSSDLVHPMSDTLELAAILDVCVVSLAFNQIWRRREKRESIFAMMSASSITCDCCDVISGE